MRLKNKFIYLMLFIFSFSLFMPGITSYCIDSDSLYVWSNTAKTVNGVDINLNKVSKEVIADTSNNTRKLFKSYLWKCYFNRTTNRKNTL